MIKRRILLLFLFIYTFQLFGQNTLVKNSDDELFRTGLELLDHEKYGAAREFFQRYINLNKNDLKSIDAEYYIAYCALNLFNADAEALFENFIATHPEHSKSALAYYDLGTFNFNNKQYGKAIEYLEKADVQRLSAFQKLERNFKLAYSYFNEKQFEKAEPLFNEIKSTENKHTYAASYYVGYIELKNGKYDEALKDLKKAEQNENYQPLVPVMIANVYYWQGNYDELIKYSESILSKTDNTKLYGKDDIFLLTADSYFKKEDYKKAAEFFKKYTTEYKTKITPEITYRLAYSEYQTGDMDNAIKDFSAIAGNKDSIAQSAAYYLGLSYLKKGKKDFAITAFDLASKTAFNKEVAEESAFLHGKVNYDIHRFHDAITALKSFSKQFPGSKHIGEVQELLSESFLRTSNYSEALTYIESLKVRSLRINTAYQRVAFYSGVQHFNNEEFQTAIQLFDKSSEFPIDKDIFLASNFWKGEAYSFLKDYTNAIRSYSTVFQKTNDENLYHLKSRYGIGYAYFNTKDYEKASPHFKNYVERLRNAKDKLFYDDALLRLADLYYQSKNYDDAIRYYDEAIRGKNLDLDYAYYQRGVVYGIKEKITEAKGSLDVVIKNYPRSLYHDDAIYEKAQLSFQQGNYDETLTGFSTIINQKAGSPYVPYSLVKRAQVYTNLNKDNEAIADYENVLSNYINHPVAQDAFLGLQQSYDKAGRPEEFKKWIDVMEKVDPKNSLLVNAKLNDAKNLYSAGKFKQAAEAFSNFLNSYPDNASNTEVQFYLADAYLQTGDTLNSIKSYEKVVETRDPLYFVKSIATLADMHFKKANYLTAKYYYSQLYANARGKKDKIASLIGLTESNIYQSKPDSAIYYAKELQTYGNTTLNAESKALLYLGRIYYSKQDYDKAIDYYLNTVNLAKDRYGAEAQYAVAEIQYKQGKYKQSLETLYDFNNNFSEYDDWIGKSFLLIADNFIAQKEYFQAKATLNSIIDNSSDTELVAKAKEKLAQVAEKEGKSNE
ncbi:MAG: tetratricopeptide repeat protein [Cytophagaceae bacterium]|nr:tetratricopeptide repeat protein [Cytophagaceae bacterium]